MLSHSSIDGSLHHNNAMHCGGDMTPMTSWLESLEAFEEPEDDYFKIEDYPLKRRQRRQRLHSLHCYVARSGVVAVAASASMLTRQVENMARVEGISHLNCQQEDANGTGGTSATFSAIVANFKSSLGCAVGGIAARLGELGSNLAHTIGEPPQRVLGGPREEQDAPLLLFWAINLCALCTFASLTLFVISFCAGMVGPTDTSSEPEAIDQIQLAPQSPLLLSRESAAAEKRKLEGLFRVLGVISLSLVSGCGLGLRHPIQSALLSGF